MSLRHLLTSARAEWFAQAMCVDLGPDIFFPASTSDQDPVVDRYCVGCPAREACVTYAVDNRIDEGVFGSTELDRRWLRRARRAAPDRPLVELLQQRRGELQEVASGS